MSRSLALSLAAALLAVPSLSAATRVVPESFLRSWDPVTLFLDAARGPAAGGPADDPGDLARLDPAHPGAWRWLDGRTLQFRPARPWPPMARFTLAHPGGSRELTTLMRPPVHSEPRAGAVLRDPLAGVRLTFADPLESDALRRMVEVTLTPDTPGAPRRVLGPEDVRVKALPRTAPDEAARYEVRFREEIPLAHAVRFRLLLGLADDDATAYDLAFRTAPPFRVLEVGTPGVRVPIAPSGSRYDLDHAIAGGAGDRRLQVQFSAPPARWDLTAARRLVRIDPPVELREASVAGDRLTLSGDFRPEIPYRVRLVPCDLQDAHGRALELPAASEVHVRFAPRPRYFRFTEGAALLEAGGPRAVRVEGRGHSRIDLRIHRVDALDRDLWPFPASGISTSDATRPPGPGEEPPRHSGPHSHAGSGHIAQHLRTLGSPDVSRIVTLPLAEDGGAARFGLDLAPHLDALPGGSRPGTYLVGLRALDGGSTRSWMRIQVTDLALSTVSTPGAADFLVTSLASGAPVRGAAVIVEGWRKNRNDLEVLFRGKTGADGTARWESTRRHADMRPLRIRVEKGGDRLVLDPLRGPERFADNHWSPSSNRWLNASFGEAPAQDLCHFFPDRPVYRPDEAVHLKGWLRRFEKGRLRPHRPAADVVVRGPDGKDRRYPVTLSETGGFYVKFDEDGLPTGEYVAHLEERAKHPWQRRRFGEARFRKEAYRVPRFEVRLHSEDEVGLDAPFEVELTASYYAGGRAGGRPVQWNVTQHPYAWTPKAREGFLYSSDGRYTRAATGRAATRISSRGTTDPSGSATLEVDPTTEKDALPRTYTVEATVSGADGQTVTSTRRVRALPPFVLGLKVPRYVPRADRLPFQLLAVGADGELREDQEVTARLLRREWHSHLQASDFASGEPRYVTDTVDAVIEERRVRTGAAPTDLEFPLPGAGVYLVELESRDALGRAQVVRVDLFAAGDEPVAWEKPGTPVFEVTPDAGDYAPGETARLLLKSPFQSARVLAVVEGPEGPRTRWLEVEGGKATFELPVRLEHAPRVPVHFLLWRGRVAAPLSSGANLLDLGRPATMAATAWVEVQAGSRRVEVDLEHPTRAGPGQEIEVTISLRDEDGAPLAGEVTLWLVDQAVLALGREAPLDPLSSFIPRVDSRLAFRDTRNLAVGHLPLALLPGGDFADDLAAEMAGAPMSKAAFARARGDILDRATVRKTFASVPYFEPALRVGASGDLAVKVKLPDNLTNFKLRAKAASGDERFGFATGHLAVRVPLAIQPGLPRFVRTGDRFLATAIGRAVDGEGGPAAVQLRAKGLDLGEGDTREVTLDGGSPARVGFWVNVPDPGYDGARLARDQVKVTMGIERAADGALDAFESILPLRPDRPLVHTRRFVDVPGGGQATLPGAASAARAGTGSRRVLISDRPGIVKMLAGLDVLDAYPFGCTEQRISRARGHLAAARAGRALGDRTAPAARDAAVKEALDHLAHVVRGDGLVSYWPGARGYVSLTAWVLEFLVEAGEANYPVDAGIRGRLEAALERSLRSDFADLIEGEAYLERCYALRALARAGKLEAGYAAELVRRARVLTLDGRAATLLALLAADPKGSFQTRMLQASLWEGISTRLHQGRELYAGLASGERVPILMILGSEDRTLAEVLRALHRADPEDPRLPVLVDGLIARGAADGWGSTQADAAALLALADVLESRSGPPRAVALRSSDGEVRHTLAPESPVIDLSLAAAGPVTVLADAGPTLLAREVTRQVPAALGSRAAPAASGFVVERALLEIREEGPARRRDLGAGGATLDLAAETLVEDHVRLVNPEDRAFVAVVVPFAAGLEPLNPALATAPAEATPSAPPTRAPDHTRFLDDRVEYFFDQLPAGTYELRVRLRATIPGSFTQPPATAEMMYDPPIRGASAGARVEVAEPVPSPEEE